MKLFDVTKNSLWFVIIWIIVVVIEIYVLLINKNFTIAVLTLGIFCVAFGFDKIKYSRIHAIIAFILGALLLVMALIFFSS